jgi:hypothetical protein
VLKRFAALFFTLALASQVLANVCGCLDEGASKHKCCKKTGSFNTTIAPKGCCDEEDCRITREDVPSSTSDNGLVKFVSGAEMAGGGKLVRPSVIFSRKRSLVPTPFVDQRIKFARPPDLYLRNHSFLI